MSTSSQPTVGYLVNRIARIDQRWSDNSLSKFGVTAASMPVLALLGSGAPLTQKELAERIGIEQPTMAHLLNRMERDGLITRIANPKDGRSAHVTLTEQAMRCLPQARSILEQGNTLATSDLSEREVTILIRLLQRYLKTVETKLR